MKIFLVVLIATLCLNKSFGQISNVKSGLWSDISVWSNNTLPTSSDEIFLSFDITVDINATCQSLSTNGHNVTVNSNINLDILGDANTTILSKYIEFDTTAMAPFDTVSKTLFYYDNAKRNVGIDLSYYQNGQLGNYQYNSTFFYNGNDTVPFKKIVNTPFLVTTDPDFVNDTCFYFYSNSLLIKDSTIQHLATNPFTEVNNYTYATGLIINNSTEYFGNPVSVYNRTDTVHLKYVNGNITSQIDSSYLSAKHDFKYVYDNHPNPFYRTQSKIAVDNRFPHYFMETFIHDIFTKNNAIEIDQFEYYMYYHHFKNIYEYKTNGYPKIVRFFDQNDPTVFGKGIYFYTN